MRSDLLTNLLGAYMEEDVINDGAGEARRNTLRGLHWKWF